MRTQAVAKMRDFLWETLHRETDSGKRTVIYEALGSSNAGWIERVFRLVTSEIALPVPAPFKSESLFYRPDPAELQGEIFLGQTEDGHRVCLPLACFGPLGDVMVTGVKGAGKSSLLKSLALQLSSWVRVAVFDTEDEYGSVLAAMDPRVLVLNFDDYRRNLFRPPPNCPQDQWVELVKGYFAEDFQLQDSALNLVSKVCATIQARDLPLSVPAVLRELRRSVSTGANRKRPF